jgi:hypothetical protein
MRRRDGGGASDGERGDDELDPKHERIMRACFPVQGATSLGYAAPQNVRVPQLAHRESTMSRGAPARAIASGFVPTIGGRCLGPGAPATWPWSRPQSWLAPGPAPGSGAWRRALRNLSARAPTTAGADETIRGLAAIPVGSNEVVGQLRAPWRLSVTLAVSTDALWHGA